MAVAKKPCSCGKPIRVESATCRACYLEASRKTARNRELARLYSTGRYKQQELAAMFNIALGTLGNILRAQGAKLEGEAKAIHRERWRKGTGRPCMLPQHLSHLREEYNRLCQSKGFSAAEAIAVLEAA